MGEPAARVELPPLPGPVDELWHVLLDLAAQVTEPWTLVGGQMVLLHALEHGVPPSWVSQDGDVVADVRAAPAALRQLVRVLEQTHRFGLEGVTPDGVGHRYERPGHPRPVVLDVLAPEGLGVNADLGTTPPGRTVEVPGGTQALARSAPVQVAHEGRVGTVPRPSLLAALVLKSAALALPGKPARHLRDLALLYGLVGDPFALAEELTRKDRRRLRLGSALADPTHEAWLLLPPEVARRGHQAREIVLS